MNQLLFVYGTLRPEHAPAEVAGAAAQLRFVQTATVAGELYDLGHYPGAILSENPTCRISGLLFELPEDESALRALDGYEEYLPQLPLASQFLRVMCKAETASGDTVQCWIYVYARSLAGARRIEDGAWSGPSG